jgi:YfiH family protein
LPHFFTDRRGGESLGVYESFNLAQHVGDDPATVEANRKSLGSVQFMNQVHGDHIEVIDGLTLQIPTCDGLITKTPDISLAVMVADCIPLLLVSQEVIGAIHVGRAGLVNQIALKAIHMMRSLGAIEIHAVLGPSICGSCYEVPFQMQQDVIAHHPRAFATTRKGTPALDLPKALIADLLSVGVSYEASTSCTFEDQMYFSHRRQNPTGRFAGVVSL